MNEIKSNQIRSQHNSPLTVVVEFHTQQKRRRTLKVYPNLFLIKILIKWTIIQGKLLSIFIIYIGGGTKNLSCYC
jgi:hypothetical protein